MKKKLLISVVLCGLIGCSSTHDLKSEKPNAFGGGYVDELIRPGLYRLTAKSNATLWPSFGAAKTTWKYRADQLCGKDAYSEINLTADEGGQGTRSTYVPLKTPINLQVEKFNATISGVLLCNSSGLTKEDAIRYLDAVEAAKKESLIARQKAAAEKESSENSMLEKVDCGNNEPNLSSERYFYRGRQLLAANRYNEAMQCFLRAQRDRSDKYIYQESCHSIAMMYQDGLGVERSQSIAQTWLDKRGL